MAAVHVMAAEAVEEAEVIFVQTRTMTIQGVKDRVFRRPMVQIREP